jgi:hypothetical protein
MSARSVIRRRPCHLSRRGSFARARLGGLGERLDGGVLVPAQDEPDSAEYTDRGHRQHLRKERRERQVEGLRAQDRRAEESEPEG